MAEHKFPEKKIEMSSEEMGAIALAYVRNDVRKGIRLHINLVRDIGEKAKECGIDFERARLFTEIMMRETVEETFSSQK